MRTAFRAFGSGLGAVARAPGMLILVFVATLLTVLPFGVMLGQEIASALAHQPPIDLAAQEIDAEWWLEYRRHATGLASTFTPAVLGFAAPLENLSALLDGTARPWALAVPVVVYGVVWAFLWGVVLQRFHHRRRFGFADVFAAGARHFLPFVTISVAAGALVLVLFRTVHPLLFGPIYDAITTRADSEPVAFAGRVGLYLVFGALLAVVSLVADYTRVALVVRNTRSISDGFVSSAYFLRAHPAAIVTLLLLSGVVFAAAFVLYGVADLRFGGWRAVLLGQAFIVGRLGLRLVSAASQVSLYKNLSAKV